MSKLKSSTSKDSLTLDEDSLLEDDDVNEDIFLTALKEQKNQNNSLNFQKHSLKQQLALPGSFINGLQPQHQQIEYNQISKSKMNKHSVSPQQKQKNTLLMIGDRDNSINIQNQTGHIQSKQVNSKKVGLQYVNQLSQNKSQSMAIMKRNTLFEEKKSINNALHYSLIKTIVKSQTQSSPEKFQSNTTHQEHTLAILDEMNTKVESKLFSHKSLKTINFTPINWSRFEGCPLKPGIQFFKMFSQVKLDALKHLQRIIIPDTLISFDRLTWLKYDFAEKKYSVRSNDFILPFYLRKTKFGIEQYHQQEIKWDEPMIIEKRFPPFMNQTLKSVMNEETFQNYLLNGLDSSCVIQNYIRPAFKNKPTFYRIVYRNQNVKQSKRKPNYGFLLSTKKQNDELKAIKSQIQSKMQKTITNFSHNHQFDQSTFTSKNIVNMDEPDQFEVYMIRNFQVLESRLEDMAQELVHFISVVYGFRVKQIVIDFIKDYKGVYYLTDVKNFTFDEFDKIRYLHLKNENPIIRQQNRIELMQRACMTQKCQLCQQKYRPAYVQNTITTKMLYRLNAHLTKRGVFLLQHLSKYQFHQEFCRVCDQCNQLVIAELELMEVERLYAIAQNIPSKEFNKIKKDDEKKLQVSSLTTNQLTQWRLMFMFKEIKGASQDAVMEQCQSGSLYLHLKILDFITSFEVCRLKVQKNPSNTKEGQIILSNQMGNKVIDRFSPHPPQKVYKQTNDENKDQSNGQGYAMLQRKQSFIKEFKLPGLQRKNTQKAGQNDSTKDQELSQQEQSNASAAAGFLNQKLNVIYENEYQQDQDPSILINKIRVHFFFTLDNNKDEFWKFLSNTEIEIRITDGPYWEGQLIGTCTGFPLQYFNCSQEIQLQPWQYYFFGPINNLDKKKKADILIDDTSSQNSHSFKTDSSKPSTKYDSMIDFTVSLKKDQKVQISENVDLYKVTGDVLFPENNYFSPLPMPKEWIEIVQMFNNHRMGIGRGSNNPVVNYGMNGTEIFSSADNTTPRRADSSDKNLTLKNSNSQSLNKLRSNSNNDLSNMKKKNSGNQQNQLDNYLLNDKENNNEFQVEKYDGIKNTPFSKDMKQNFSHSLKIFKTVQDQNLLSKRMSSMNSVSPIFQKQNKSRNNISMSAAGNVANNSQGKQKEIFCMQDLDDITDDQILLQQLKLIDAKNQTLREVNTHYDPKYIYTSTQAVKKLQQIKKQKEKLAQHLLNQENPKKKREDGSQQQHKFGGKQDKYKYKNYQIEHSTILNQRKQVAYQLKKKNYQAIKDIIDSKKQQMLHIIPDDNSLIQQLPQHQKHKIQKLGSGHDSDTPNNQQNGSQTQLIYGDHLTVSRKNSLKNTHKRPSMIMTKVSTDKLEVYNPLYASQKSSGQDQNGKGENMLQRSTSIVKIKNSNVIQSSTKNTNIFQIVSQTYKEFEKRNKDLTNIDILSPISKKSKPPSPINGVRKSSESFDRGLRSSSEKPLVFKPIKTEDAPKNRKESSDFNKTMQPFEDKLKNFKIQELDESVDFSSLNSNSQLQKTKITLNKGNLNGGSNSEVKKKQQYALKPPIIKNSNNQGGNINRNERIQSAMVSTKSQSRFGKQTEIHGNSFLRTTFYNTLSKFSKISPKKSSQASNSTLYANFLPWIDKPISGETHSQSVLQISKTITNNNLNTISQEIGRFNQSDSLHQNQLTNQDFDHQDNVGYNTVDVQVQQDPYNIPLSQYQIHQGISNDGHKIQSKKRRRQKRQKEFKEKYGGILQGDLRKDIKLLTRSQQKINKDLGGSLKRTTIHQEQLIRVYGIEGEKQLVQNATPKNLQYLQRRNSYNY
eukprot:403364979